MNASFCQWELRRVKTTDSSQYNGRRIALSVKWRPKSQVLAGWSGQNHVGTLRLRTEQVPLRLQTAVFFEAILLFFFEEHKQVVLFSFSHLDLRTV